MFIIFAILNFFLAIIIPALQNWLYFYAKCVLHHKQKVRYIAKFNLRKPQLRLNS